jgi:hypothetical protein
MEKPWAGWFTERNVAVFSPLFVLYFYVFKRPFGFLTIFGADWFPILKRNFESPVINKRQNFN